MSDLEQLFLLEEEEDQDHDTEHDSTDVHEEGDIGEAEQGDLEEIEEEALTGLATAQIALEEETKIIRLTKDSQISNLTGRASLILARRAKDPLYTKYAHFNSLRLDLKKRIAAKYASKSVMYARKIYAEAQRRRQASNVKVGK